MVTMMMMMRRMKSLHTSSIAGSELAGDHDAVGHDHYDVDDDGNHGDDGSDEKNEILAHLFNSWIRTWR